MKTKLNRQAAKTAKKESAESAQSADYAVVRNPSTRSAEAPRTGDTQASARARTHARRRPVPTPREFAAAVAPIVAAMRDVASPSASAGVTPTPAEAPPLVRDEAAWQERMRETEALRRRIISGKRRAARRSAALVEAFPTTAPDPTLYDLVKAGVRCLRPGRWAEIAAALQERADHFAHHHGEIELLAGLADLCTALTPLSLQTAAIIHLYLTLGGNLDARNLWHVALSLRQWVVNAQAELEAERSKGGN